MNDKQLACFSFLIFGIVSLAPWNLVISSLDYYRTKCMYKNFPFVFTLPNIAASYLFGILILFKSRQLSKTFKVYLPLIFSIVFMLLTPGTAYILDKTYGYILFFLSIFFSAGLTTLTQMYALSTAGSLHPTYLFFFATGTGLSGIITSLIKIFDLLALNEGLNDETKLIKDIQYGRFNAEMIYYAINVIFFVGAIAMYYKCCQGGVFKTNFQNNDNNNEIKEKLMDFEEVDNFVSEENEQSLTMGQIMKKQFVYELLIVILITQTFFLFPGFVLKKKLNIVNVDWKNAFFLLVFNCADTFGKGINIIFSRFSKLRLIIFIVFRLIITLPIIMLAKGASFYLFQCNWFPFIIIFFFGFTNGYGFAQIIYQAARLFKSKKDIEIGQQLLFMFFTLGTTFGTFIAFGISKI